MGNAPRTSSNARRSISKLKSAGFATPAHPHVRQPRMTPKSFRGNNAKLLEFFPALFTDLFTFGFFQLNLVHHHLSASWTEESALEHKSLSLRPPPPGAGTGRSNWRRTRLPSVANRSHRSHLRQRDPRPLPALVQSRPARDCP